MQIAIIFVASPGSTSLLHEIEQRLRIITGGIFHSTWLAEGEALDIVGDTDGVDLGSLKRAISELVASEPVDWCVQPAATRRKRMLIADMDSTIIGQECLDEMAALKGIKPQIAAITDRAMRGEIDFESALHERVNLLFGLSKLDLQRVLDERITLNPGARELVGTMRTHGAHTVLVSGGFTFFTEAVAKQAGFTMQRGNSFLWKNGRLCGVANPILGREAKLAALTEESAAHGLDPNQIMAVGDGANDLAMLKAAGLGVAYYAKPVVAAEADAQINHTALTTLLYFQGYSAAEIRFSSN